MFFVLVVASMFPESFNKNSFSASIEGLFFVLNYLLPETNISSYTKYPSFQVVCFPIHFRLSPVELAVSVSTKYLSYILVPYTYS